MYTCTLHSHWKSSQQTVVRKDSLHIPSNLHFFFFAHFFKAFSSKHRFDPFSLDSTPFHSGKICDEIAGMQLVCLLRIIVSIPCCEGTWIARRVAMMFMQEWDFHQLQFNFLSCFWRAGYGRPSQVYPAVENAAVSCRASRASRSSSTRSAPRVRQLDRRGCRRGSASEPIGRRPPGRHRNTYRTTRPRSLVHSNDGPHRCT